MAILVLKNDGVLRKNQILRNRFQKSNLSEEKINQKRVFEACHISEEKTIFAPLKKRVR